MPSLELTRIVEKYDANTVEGRNDPKRRIEACQQMWQLRDPEAILFLKIIYQEDPNPLVQAEAAEVLTNFRRIQREREATVSGKTSKGTGLGWRLLRTILLLTFVGLVILNGLFFWVNSRKDDSDGTETPVEGNEGVTEISSREEILAAFEQSLSDLVDDSLKLQIEWQKIEDGNSGDCTIPLARPQPLTESQIQQFPDISTMFPADVGDYQFSFGNYNIVLLTWDTYCSGAPLEETDRVGNVDRLAIAIGTATNIRVKLLPTLIAATAIPTIGPSPTDTLPPSATPMPTATLTLEPLANVRYEEHLSALERTMRDSRSALQLIEIKWNPDTRGRPICSLETLGTAYVLPDDQRGDPDLDEAVQLVADALNDAAEADLLFNEQCNNNTLNIDPTVDPTLTGLRLINSAFAKFDMAQEKINALRIKVGN